MSPQGRSDETTAALPTKELQIAAVSPPALTTRLNSSGAPGLTRKGALSCRQLDDSPFPLPLRRYYHSEPKGGDVTHRIYEDVWIPDQHANLRDCNRRTPTAFEKIELCTTLPPDHTVVATLRLRFDAICFKTLRSGKSTSADCERPNVLGEANDSLQLLRLSNGADLS